MVFPSSAGTQTCPCGTGTAYRACCGPLHDGERAPTAELLMRSRYSAYVLGREDYLFRTWHPRTRPEDLSPAGDVTWLGLEILATSGGEVADDTGTVEFVARSRASDGLHALHETSRFVRRNGRWVYVDGDVAPGVQLRGAP
jgi:SEC-C motif-containing protein